MQSGTVQGQLTTLRNLVAKMQTPDPLYALQEQKMLTNVGHVQDQAMALEMTGTQGLKNARHGQKPAPNAM